MTEPYRGPDGVLWSPRLCYLISGPLLRTARATLATFGDIYTELARAIRATYEAGQEWARTGAHASESGHADRGTPQSKDDALLTPKEVAAVLGITPNGVRDAVRREKLVAARRNPILIERAELDRFIKRRAA